MLKPGDRFRHYKTGNMYRVLSLFTWEPTLEPAVLYESEKSHEVWGRLVRVFMEMVSNPAEAGAEQPRFQLVQAAEDRCQLYSMVEKQDGQGFPYLEVYTMADPVLTLKDGHAQVIGLSFLNMSRINPQRGDDFMAGVTAGCVHMTLLKGQESTNKSPPVLPLC